MPLIYRNTAGQLLIDALNQVTFTCRTSYRLWVTLVTFFGAATDGNRHFHALLHTSCPCERGRTEQEDAHITCCVLIGACPIREHLEAAKYVRFPRRLERQAADRTAEGLERVTW